MFATLPNALGLSWVQNRKELEDSVAGRDRTLGKYFHQTFISPCCAVLNLSHVWHFATPWTVARQPPLSMGVSRPEPWTGLPWPPPGDLPKWSNPSLPHWRWILYHLRHQGSLFILLGSHKTWGGSQTLFSCCSCSIKNAPRLSAGALWTGLLS